MGVVSAPLHLPSLLSPSASSRACRTHNTTRQRTFSFHLTHGYGHCHGHSSSIARAKTRKMSVRADASLSELATNAAAVYGGLLLGGGVFAYSRTSSIGSLLGGLSGGILMGLVFFLSLNPGSKDLGEAIGFGTALLFVAVFGIRLAATKKVFPAAPLLLLSMAATAVFVSAYLQDRV